MPDTDDPLPAPHGGPSEPAQPAAGGWPPEPAQPDAPAPTPVPMMEPTAQFPPVQPAPNDPAYAGAPAQPADPAVGAYPATPGYLSTPGFPSTPAYPGAAAPYPGAYGGQVFYQQPPKKRRTGLIIGIVAAVLIVLCGGATVAVVAISVDQAGKPTASSATSLPAADPTQTTSASPSPSPSPSDGPVYDGSLVKYLIPKPSGAHSVKDPMGTNNVLTAKQDAAQWTNADGRKWRLDLLQSDVFTTGAARQWVTTDLYVEIDLLGFRSTNGAKLFFTVDTDDPHYLGTAPSTAKASSTPEGMIFYTKKRDKYGDERAFAAARCGNVSIEVWVDQYKTLSMTLINSLLHKQYVELCP